MSENHESEVDKEPTASAPGESGINSSGREGLDPTTVGSDDAASSLTGELDEGGQDENEDAENEDARIKRRAALKLAAGAAAAGAVWTAPKLDGFSVVPNYAAAGTAVVPAKTFRIDTADIAANYPPPGYYNPQPSPDAAGGPGDGCSGQNGDVYALSTPANPGISVNSSGPTASSAINFSYPLGPAGNVVVKVPNGADADSGVTTNIDVAFNIDPPFNKCRVNAAALYGCNAQNTAIPLTINNNPTSGAPNPAPFTATVVSTPPGPVGAAHHVTITVACT
ncbi:MAG: hypothetical protein KDB26_13325 [Microthrixaceae bacterium]|nr:hypothetical protein [Microthrixaceae bacterium]